jgi:hypothetical protein
MTPTTSGYGAVYVFEFDGATWTQTARLVDDVGGGNGTYRFGHSVDLDEDRALVGSPGAERALYFEYDGAVWTREGVLTVEDVIPYRFHAPGHSVALDGDRALVGSPWTTVAETRMGGAVFGFDLGPTGWTLRSEVNLGPQRRGDRFGSAVAVSGDRVAVCAAGRGLGQTWPYAPPSVHVFSVTGGPPAMEFRAPTTCEAVALGSDQLLVGSPGTDIFNTPHVSVYARGTSGWALSQTLYGVGAFGTSVSLDGDRALVGAPGAGTSPGQAYLYERSGTRWQLVTTLRPAAPEDAASFGTSVALDGGRAVVGAPYTQAGSSYGLAYVYESDGDEWARVATLASAGPGPNGLFGAAVAASGGRALVGAPSSPAGGGVDGGNAYVFDGLAWTQTATLGARGPRNTSGAAVALDGGRALVGAPRAGATAGSVALYGYDGAGWSQTADVQSPGLVDGEQFGASVAVEGRRFVVGAPYPVVEAPEAGRVYLYRDRVTVADEVGPVAGGPRLQAPRPNPSSTTSHLVLSLSQPERVTATVYDALGRSVQTVLNGEPVSGEVEFSVDARALAPGLYVVRVVGETFAESRTLVVAR